jgi:hypothetical protein
MGGASYLLAREKGAGNISQPERQTSTSTVSVERAVSVHAQGPGFTSMISTSLGVNKIMDETAQ